MWLLLSLAVQASAPSPAMPTPHQVLAAEHARGGTTAVLDAALASRDTLLQRLAIRAYGRWEQKAHVSNITPLFQSASPAVRREVVLAYGQLGLRTPPAWISSERDPGVRSALFATLGRTADAGSDAAATLTGGLREADMRVRRGAARGLESYMRRTARTSPPTPATLAALRRAVVDNADTQIRQLALLALNTAGDRDSATMAVALRDTSAQVRRLAVLTTRRWVDDPSPIVRYEAVRLAASCDQATRALGDASEHVVLAAIDVLGTRRCDGTALDSVIRNGRTWRMQGRALVARARADSTRTSAARAMLPAMAASRIWQQRVNAATAARLLGDSATLATLARDAEPNVAIAAINTTADALRGLTSDHFGLVLASATRLKGAADLASHQAALVAALERLSRRNEATTRDPRVALLQRLGEVADASTAERLMPLLGDADPEVAALAARVISDRIGRPVTPTTLRYAPAPFPSAAELDALRGARAIVRVKDVGTMEITLRPEDAPATVATFAALARRGAFNGLTWHRIVPNFVLQGGSPGADEYDGLTSTFMRDEVSDASHLRGTFGISTRGRDTGDGQLFINLIDNFRLDHDYTVFAEMHRGFDVMDRVQEGDVIESVTLVMPDAGDDSFPVGARTPAFAADGRLAMAVNGHLMLQREPGGPLTPLTAGSAWDRDPAWTADGSAIVFASDRSGNYDIWRVEVKADGTAGTLTQVTRSPEHETWPSVGPAGEILFLRGSGNATRVWLRAPDGREARVTNSNDTERAPQLSRNGAFAAFLTLAESGRKLSIWSPATADAKGVQRLNQTVDATTDHLSWAWDNERLALSTRAGVMVLPRTGTYTNFVTSARGHTAWSPDDRQIAVASFNEVTVGYNGDPDRGADRSAVSRSPVVPVSGDAPDQLTFTAAPLVPDRNTVQPLTGGVTRAARNGAEFDRVWELSARLYFSAPEAAAKRAQWEAVKRSHRPRALAAVTDSALQDVIHEALSARPTLRDGASGRAVVSSAHPVATRAGLEVMERGGNVVDAAVATSFALGVVEPDASGIAGYGEMVIALKTLAQPTVIEFMSRVPEDAGLDNTSLLVNGRYPSDGPVLVNVPGTVAGMYAAWEKYGSKKLPWKELLAPAIRAATNGYEVSEGLATTLATEREHFAKYEGSRALFFRNGEPLRAGDTLRNPDLAWVLTQIAERGADGFYKGEVASKWVADLHAKGNAMKLSDLARYFAPERDAVVGTYRNYTIYSSAPPVSGGAELVARFNLLEQFPSPRTYRDDAASLHAALSAWFLVPSSRGRIADPSLWPVDYAPIISKDTARVRWGCYRSDRALRPDLVRGDTLACLKEAIKTDVVRDFAAATWEPDHRSPCGEDHAAEMTVCHSSGTTAFTVADNDGNMVAVTQTLGTWGGNFYVTPGLGFLSNDKLTSYGTDPSQYGARLPFARNGSTLAPTIAYRNGKPFVGVGAAGNAWITAAVYQSLLGVLDYDLSAQQALELPRFLPGGGGGGGAAAGRGAGASSAPPPYTLQLEDGFAPEVIRRLHTLGYTLNFVSLRGELREGYGAVVRVDGKTASAGADPRRSGSAGAIR